MSSSVHVDQEKKYILILGEGPTKGLDDTTSTEGKKQSINFTESRKFCLSVHYNGANSSLFVNDAEIHKFKSKDSQINAVPICLESISKDVPAYNMKKIRIK